MVSGIFIMLLNLAYLRSCVSMVQTTSGPVDGILGSYQGILVDMFLGIPYAAPPVGDLRFKRTVPVQPWIAPLKANIDPPACVQYFPYKYPWIDQMPGQSEDCLYLNIWAPRSANSTSEKSVMFWIHGGGFTSGSNRIKTYEGGILAAKGDVIVVTINYRLGVFGFLSTPSEEAPGNMGFYDMLEALRWVKSNIPAFGGDPDSITLFGESAGSKVIGLFCVSPLTIGLFRRVIMQSSAPTKLVEDTSYQKNLQLSARLIAEVGCAQNNATLEQDSVAIIQCLRSKDASILAYATDALSNFDVHTYSYIIGDALMPTNPRVAVRNLQFHDVDVLIGNNQDEGAFELPVFKPELFGPFGEKNPRINKTFGSTIIPQIISSFPAPEAAVQWYLGGLQEYDYDYIRSQVYHAFGDYILFCPAVYFAESYARKGNSVYYYYFNHRSSETPWADWMGVVHTDEIPFVFGRPLDGADTEEKSFEAHYTSPEKQLSEEMISMWTNFAKFGMPSSEWPTFSRGKPRVRTFELEENRESYLKQHLENCEFFRPYFGFNSSF
ncbi:acetylcholinesterase-1-like [Uloborus diversus]|uniref:acetylcholinesterase-1-like n=1 Tax=Uloborus diversus TaxID=327109 RepID=UPI0024094830|nr:acetylcholinesterase-1-like [Uloborus diversus]